MCKEGVGMGKCKSIESTSGFRVTGMYKRVVVASCGGSFLDGYVLTLIGVALAQIVPYFELTPVWNAAIGAAVFVGMFFGTICGGWLTDRLGRKLMFDIDLIAVALISLMSVFVSNPFELVLARFLVGLFIGADYPIATSLIAEYSPKEIRAKAFGLVTVMWYVGATVAALVGFSLYSLDDGWRLMLGSSVIPCVIIAIGRSGIPESPMWLARRGRMEEARQSVAAVFEGVVIPGIELDSDQKPKSRYVDMLKGGYLKRIVVLGLLIMCEVVPLYAVYVFGPQILSAFGLGMGNESVLGEGLISVFFLVGTIPAIWWLDTIGRRPLLIRSLALMALGLLALALFPEAPIALIIAFFALYALASGGPNVLTWLYPNELFPTEVRASAVGVSFGISRIGTIVGTFATPLLLNAFGVATVMLIATALTVAGLVLAVLFAEETKGKTLSETSALE